MSIDVFLNAIPAEYALRILGPIVNFCFIGLNIVSNFSCTEEEIPVAKFYLCLALCLTSSTLGGNMTDTCAPPT